MHSKLILSLALVAPTSFVQSALRRKMDNYQTE